MGAKHWTKLRDDSFRPAPVVRARTPGQAAYLAALDRARAVFCAGPAGSGKTYLACAKAVEHLRAGKVEAVVLTRPLRECGEPMGWLPGDLYEKVVDMMMPLLEALEEFLGAAEVGRMRADGRLKIIPLEKMRGRSLKNAFVVLDEAQNATYAQLKMFVTRFGAKCKMVACGDYTQSDLPYAGPNSYRELTDRFRRMPPRPDVALVALGKEDIVRDELVRWFVEATDGPPPGGTGGYAAVPCPGCDADLWYPAAAEADDRLVVCPGCHGHVELTDEAGRLAPAVIADPDPADVLDAVPGMPARPEGVGG